MREGEGGGKRGGEREGGGGKEVERGGGREREGERGGGREGERGGGGGRKRLNNTVIYIYLHISEGDIGVFQKFQIKHSPPPNTPSLPRSL